MASGRDDALLTKERGVDDKYDKLGPQWNAVGVELARVTGNGGESALLYAEIGEGWVSPNIYIPDGDVVRFHLPDNDDFTALLFQAWYLEEVNKRWSTVEYRIEKGRFSAAFGFPDEVDVRDIEGADERRDAVVRRYFGDKRVVYPPLGPEAQELTLNRDGRSAR
jgi:hypothetical protein